MAVQLIFTNGIAARGEWWWIARAIMSLPTPDSPHSSTVDRVGATRATAARISCIFGLLPTMESNL